MSRRSSPLGGAPGARCQADRRSDGAHGPTIVWTVVPTATPCVRRRCARCKEKRRFASTGRFRVNAQGRVLDVWLVYRCEECGATWNCTVLPRTHVARVDADLLDRFLRNDEETAWRYAFDRRLLAANGAEPDGPVEYHVQGASLSSATRAPDASGVRVTIALARPIRVRLGDLLARALGMSRREVRRLVTDGAVRVVDGETDLAARVKERTTLVIRPLWG